MKSIKEKAEEYAKNYFFANVHFEAGANYVLDEVEILLNNQRFVDNPSQELYEHSKITNKTRKFDPRYIL